VSLRVTCLKPLKILKKKLLELTQLVTHLACSSCVYVNLKLKIIDQNIITYFAVGTVGLRCCSEWFEQLSSRISKCLSNSWFSSRQEVVPALWNGDGRSDSRRRGYCQLRCNHWPISLRHYSECRPISRKTLHRGSLRERRRSVCTYVRIGAATMLHYKALLIRFRLPLAFSWCLFSPFPANNCGS